MLNCYVEIVSICLLLLLLLLLCHYTNSLSTPILCSQSLYQTTPPEQMMMYQGMESPFTDMPTYPTQQQRDLTYQYTHVQQTTQQQQQQGKRGKKNQNQKKQQKQSYTIYGVCANVMMGGSGTGSSGIQDANVKQKQQQGRAERITILPVCSNNTPDILHLYHV